MQYRTIFWCLLAGTIFITGCDTVTPVDTENSSEKSNPQDESVQVSGADVEFMRERLNQATRVMSDVVRDPEAVDALYRAVKLRDDQGFDENVSFAHMLARDSQVSQAYADIRDPFEVTFNQALTRAAKESEGAFTAKGLRAFLINSGTIIRLPYHDRFRNVTQSPTVAAHPLTPEAEKANPELTVNGLQPVEGEVEQHNSVPVNRAYAMDNPTYIIAPCDGLEVQSALSRVRSGITTYCGGGSVGGPGDGDDGDEGSGDDISPDDEFGAFLDWMQCREDTDSIFSGGPDYRVFIYEPEIDEYPVDPSEDTYDSYFEVNQFSGSDCDDNDWEQVGTVWDSSWEQIDEENGFLVYDWDRFGGTTIEYSVGYDGEVGGFDVDGSVDGSIDLNNDSPLFNITINRDAFASTNRENCRNLGTRDGNCIRGGGSSVRFTLGANLIN